MKNNKLILVIMSTLVVAVVVMGSALVLSSNRNVESEKAEIPVSEYYTCEVSALWPGYSFEEAIDTADRIVIGKVTNKSETKKNEGYDDSGKLLVREYYKDVTIEVESIVKGTLDTNSINYVEPGGEMITIRDDGTASVNNWEYSGVRRLQVGERVLLFLKEKGTALSPATVFVISNEGSINVSSDILPATKTRKSQSHYMETYKLNDYLAEIKEYIDNNK